MGVETELKFRVPAGKLKTLVSRPIPGSAVRERSEDKLVSTYFDTTKHKLRRHGLSLRVRRTGQNYIQTIKAESETALGRGEWETQVKGDPPDLGKVDGTPLDRFASKKLRRKLKPIFATSVHRLTLPVRTKGGEIEFAIDRGRIVAGRHSSPIDELELELKKGRPADLFRAARAIERKSEAELYLRTKSERGYDLARGKGNQVVFARPIKLRDDMAASEAFRIIGRSCLRHFAGNTDAVRARDAKGVHQMRVGLRRLRAAVSIFSDLLPDAGAERIKTELKWLTSELARARELDVFVKEKLTPAARDIAPRRGGRAIEAEFSRRTADALERARRSVATARFRALLLDVLEWIETGHKVSGDADIAVGKFARDALHRRIRKARKDGRHLIELSVRRRHKLRIRVKKIRYAVEFFESLFPGKRKRKQFERLSKHLKRLQHALGSLNDFVAHRQIAADAALNAPPQNRRARAFTSGVVVGKEIEAAKPLMKAADKEVRALRRFRKF